MYNNAWFVIGYCHLANNVRYFKLNRIENFTILYYEKKFIKPRSFDRKEYFDETGFKVGIDWSNNSWDGSSANVKSDWVHIKLKLSGKPAMYVKEFKYGENQVVTAVDKDTTILECDMHYRYNAIKFVLGFGVDCKVLEPQWLKEEVVSIAKQMAEMKI
jgi:predicted DNA-binding transcriptional regulator YafY